MLGGFVRADHKGVQNFCSLVESPLHCQWFNSLLFWYHDMVHVFCEPLFFRKHFPDASQICAKTRNRTCMVSSTWTIYTTNWHYSTVHCMTNLNTEHAHTIKLSEMVHGWGDKTNHRYFDWSMLTGIIEVTSIFNELFTLIATMKINNFYLLLSIVP